MFFLKRSAPDEATNFPIYGHPAEINDPGIFTASAKAPMRSTTGAACATETAPCPVPVVALSLTVCSRGRQQRRGSITCEDAPESNVNQTC
jgi:hypothetical protein